MSGTLALQGTNCYLLCTHRKIYYKTWKQRTVLFTAAGLCSSAHLSSISSKLYRAINNPDVIWFHSPKSNEFLKSLGNLCVKELTILWLISVVWFEFKAIYAEI